MCCSLYLLIHLWRDNMVPAASYPSVTYSIVFGLRYAWLGLSFFRRGFVPPPHSPCRLKFIESSRGWIRSPALGGLLPPSVGSLFAALYRYGGFRIFPRCLPLLVTVGQLFSYSRRLRPSSTRNVSPSTPFHVVRFGGRCSVAAVTRSPP